MDIEFVGVVVESDVSKVNTCVALEACNPTDETSPWLPNAPNATLHRTHVSDTQLVAIADDTSKRRVPEASAKPKLDPTTVTLVDPVPATFTRTAELTLRSVVNAALFEDSCSCAVAIAATVRPVIEGALL